MPLKLSTLGGWFRRPSPPRSHPGSELNRSKTQHPVPAHTEKQGTVEARALDPELLAIGLQLAGIHLEAGSRDFVSVCRSIAGEIDAPLVTLRPYLRTWFNGARDMLEDHGVDISDASTAEEVRSAMARFDQWALGTGEAASEPEPTREEVRGLMGRALSTPTSDAIMNFVGFASRMKRLAPFNLYMV